MVSQKRVWALLEVWHSIFVNALELDEWDISYMVCTEKSKQYKEMEIIRIDEMAASYINKDHKTKEAIILIYNHLHKTDRQVIGTIYHELLHVRFRELMFLITKRTKKALQIEEKLIQELEAILLASLKGAYE